MKNIRRILIFIILLNLLIFSHINKSFSVNLTDDKNNKEQINLYCEAGLLIEPNTKKILYDKNAKEKKYPASTTKILTAIIAIEKCNLDDVVTVDYESVMSVPSGYTVAALQVGEQLTVKQLLQVLLVHSANDAANVLATHVSGSIEKFADTMNKKAEEIGCKDSHFLNPSGKHENDHYTTAYDLALIMNYCMKNEIFKDLLSSKSCIIPETNKYQQRVFTNTNELLIVDTREIQSNYYSPYVIAGKTGYTAEAKNCLVSMAQKDDLELICVVLGGLKTETGLSARFVDSKKLYEYGYNNYFIKKIREKDAIATQIEVENATKETKDLDLLICDDINVLIDQKNPEKNYEPEITINDNISAPINQGEILGKIKYNVEGIEYTSNLYASHSVEKNNFIFLFIQIILIFIIIFILYKQLSQPKKKKRRH